MQNKNSQKGHENREQHTHIPLEKPLDMPMASPGFSARNIASGKKKWDTDSTLEALDQAVVQATLGQVLQKARKASGLTGTEVGEFLGISKARVGQLEKLDSGKVELQTVIKLARALGYEVKIELIPQEQGKEVLAAHF